MLTFPATWKTPSQPTGIALLQGGAVVERALGQRDAPRPQARHVRPGAMQSDHAPSVGEQRVDDVEAEETRGARDECGGRGHDLAQSVLRWLALALEAGEAALGDEAPRRIARAVHGPHDRRHRLFTNGAVPRLFATIRRKLEVGLAFELSHGFLEITAITAWLTSFRTNGLSVQTSRTDGSQDSVLFYAHAAAKPGSPLIYVMTSSSSLRRRESMCVVYDRRLTRRSEASRPSRRPRTFAAS